ncbi:HAD family hydrolase [uncultured Lacinutrix sp.]|uniref:HAD family hydrolase n=1 Tax=uncultured Lacinutrix sp. TaxID=574032 RepID=UPI0026254034|nr:HAD family hydrolase [uncultured Lacinutrix sp.]
MSLSNVKLVVSDLDGTLLNSNHEVSPLFFELFKKMKLQNILFVAASGRPYYSMIDKLDSIKDDIIIVSENGALAIKNNTVLLSNAFDSKNISEITNIVTNLKETHPVFCTRNKAYLRNTSKTLITFLNEYYSNYIIIDDFSKIKEDIYKIALYNEDSSERHIYPFVKHLEDRYKVKVSANHWVDISENIANKGYAIKLIQEKYNISPEETMVFGDYNNDLEMLKLAKYSYAMENAHPLVKDTANFSTKSNDENGVEFILEKLVNSKH